MDLIVAGVVIVHSQLVEVPGNVVGGTGIRVPIVVDAAGGGKSSIALSGNIIVVAVPAVFGSVANLVANLALQARRTAVVAAIGLVVVVETATVGATTTASPVLATPGIGASTAMIPASPGSSHGRQGTTRHGVLLKLHVLLKAQELSVELAWGDRIHTSDNHGEHRVVLRIKTGEEVGDEFIIA
jgi:hypothetical protein